MQRRIVKIKLDDYRMKITIVVYDEDTFIMQHDHTVLADDTVRLIFRDLDKQYEVKR
jgi:hypothetical protein